MDHPDSRTSRGAREANLYRMLLRSMQGMNRTVMARIATRGFDDVSATYPRLLANLDTDGTRITTIAERMGVSRQAAGRLAIEIESKGYVERLVDPDDARATLVVFTELGLTLLRTAISVIGEVEQEYEAALGSAAYRQLKARLQGFIAIADPDGGFGR
jgi:DNA-binding MarR family transcriptional regulator